MTAQASSDVNAGFDAVEHPRHYNIHPSGIECVEYSELLPGNLSHVCVYVWRHAQKGKPEEDLRKALWFLDRELARNADEQEESRRLLGVDAAAGPWSSTARTRVTDRLRHLARFEKEKEFVAMTVIRLCHYELTSARALIDQHLERYRSGEKHLETT